MTQYYVCSHDRKVKTHRANRLLQKFKPSDGTQIQQAQVGLNCGFRCNLKLPGFGENSWDAI
jgi:hypothetical protein